MAGGIVKHQAAKKRQGRRRKPKGRGKAAMPSLAALAEAETYELPFGRWRGYSLAQVAERDAQYLQWAGDVWDGVAGQTVRTYLAGQAKE